jgi:site-specific recombinase XerD
VGRFQEMTITEAFYAYDLYVLQANGRVQKTRNNYSAVYKSIIRAIGDLPIELFDDEQLAMWKIDMERDGKTGTTRRGYILDFRKVVRYHVKKRVPIPVIIDKEDLPENDTAPREFLRPHEVDCLIAAGKNPRDKAILACIFIAGTRISELLDLDRIEGEASPV